MRNLRSVAHGDSAMPRLQPHPRYLATSGVVLLGVLRLWIGVGLLCLIATPVAVWHNHYIGWLPWWLLVAPTLSLALARRQPIAAALSSFLVRRRRRRKPSIRRSQARRGAVAILRKRLQVPCVEAVVGR